LPALQADMATWQIK